MRKLFTLFVTVLMTANMWALTLVDGYYQIGTAQDLKDFAALVNNGNTTANGKLTANINLQGSSSNQWTPIGNGTYSYNGTFDGQGFTISNLYYHQEVGGVGLFGRAGSSARIKNVRAIVDIDNTGNGATACCGATSAGGILGIGVEGTLIINCSVAGSVISFSNVGGIVGLGPVTVVNSYNEATVKFYNNNGQVGGGLHGWGGPATLINCYNVGQVFNTSADATSHMGNIAVNATTTNCYSLVNSCQNGAGAAWSNQAPNGIPGTTMSLSEMQAAAFTNTLYSNALALRSTYPDIDTWMQDPTTGRPILKQSYKPTEGPWQYQSMTSGVCWSGKNHSISYNDLNHSHFGEAEPDFVVNSNGLGFHSASNTLADYKMCIYSLYSSSQSVPAYTRIMLTWNYQIRSHLDNLAQQAALYAHNDVDVLKAEPLDFTYNNNTDAGSTYRIGLVNHGGSTKDATSSYSHDFYFDNSTGSSEQTKSWYLILTQVLWSGGGGPYSYDQWATFKNLTYSTSYDYYKHITFDANGGLGSMPQQQIENSGNVAANTFTYAHKVFNGWSDGVNTYAEGAAITATADSKGPVTLYAQWIDAPVASLNAPTAQSLTYNGSAQTLISAGSTNDGIMEYSLDGTNWSTALPAATNVGSYTVYYRVVADNDHSDNAGSSIAVTIHPAVSAITALPTAITGLMYNGELQTLATAGSATGGTMEYTVDGGAWSTELPKAEAIGDHTVSYRVTADANHTDIAEASFVVNIAPVTVLYDNANPTVALTGLVNSGEAYNVTINRTVYAMDYYNTICLPFDVSAAELADAAHPLHGYSELMAFDGAEVTGSGQNIFINVYVTPADHIEAGIPYFISYPSSHGDIVNPTFPNVVCTQTTPGSVTRDGVTFQGMFGPKHITTYAENVAAGKNEDYLFLGANNRLLWPNNDGTSMRGFRAYFILHRDNIPASRAPRGSNARIVMRDNTATSVETVESGELRVESIKVLRDGQLIIIRNGVEYTADGKIVK